ncbi:3-phosphoshikimate 1-carboxyvinyltransferase [Kitasatospora sp. NPDC093550]|uniref:3-phosphoshikimate 1-carboxyvinyltransferase n=1 Tax=Kitasatospora sp. NPDC093550 TaxID=3364089 RepID=UPI00380457D9
MTPPHAPAPAPAPAPGAHVGTAEVFGPAAEQPDRVLVGPLRAGTPAPAWLYPHPDKAISQRATILAALADGTSRLSNLADCRDVRANLRALSGLGVAVEPLGPRSVAVTGRAVADIRARGLTLDVGNSATTSRLLLALLAGSGASCTVTGNELLRARPMGEVVRPLRALGADLAELGDPDRLPIRVTGTRLRGGEVEVTVDSAQPVSALLLAATAADGPVRVRRRTAARDHTERLLRWTGVPVQESGTDLLVTPRRPTAFDLTVPGDPSAAAFLAALHLASPGSAGELTLREVCLNRRRTGFLRVVEAMGARVEEIPRGGAAPEPVGDIRVSLPGPLTGTEVSGPALVQSCIDELPLVAALATTARGTTVVRDAAELRGKDTDRIASVVELLRAFGASARATDDGLVVEPSPLVAPARVDLPADHRIIFAAFVLAVLSGGTTELSGTAAVATSNPSALRELARFASVEAL